MSGIEKGTFMICKHLGGKECLLTGIEFGDRYFVRPESCKGLWLEFSEMGLDDLTKEDGFQRVQQAIRDSFCETCPKAAATAEKANQ